MCGYYFTEIQLLYRNVQRFRGGLVFSWKGRVRGDGLEGVEEVREALLLPRHLVDFRLHLIKLST